MANFMENLWNSVFTPGATPTLLIATNATFAALQLTLGGLLIATYSIHFLILSVLSGGLWWAINWFAVELQQAQAKEEEAERLRRKKRDGWKESGEVEDSAADDEGGDTETEMERQEASTASLIPDETLSDATLRQGVQEALQQSGQNTQAGKATGLQPPGERESRHRRIPTDMSSEVSSSTDGEWEKVDDER